MPWLPFRKSRGTLSQDLSWDELLDDIDENGEKLALILRNWLRNGKPQAQDGQRRQEVQAVADRIPPHFLTHQLVRDLEKNKIFVGHGLSFHRYMVEESEMRKMKLTSHSWALNRKTTAYRFVDALGVRRPRTEVARTSFERVSWQFPGVLKAESTTGGRGAYLIFAEDEIVHVLDGQRFSSKAEVAEHAHHLMSPDNPRRLPNRWIMEELVLEDRDERVAARDVKFFCFYGEVLFVLEVIRNGKQSQYAFTRPDGSSVRPGGWDYTYFDSAGPTAEGLELATKISKQIPHPFMRIDMLKGEDELVFGEFTPRPGRFHEFSPEWDRRMGEAWARAEDRIQKDLLSGKHFESFLSATQVYGER